MNKSYNPTTQVSKRRISLAASVIALAVQAVCVLVGGWLGNLLFGRWRRRRAASRH